MRVVAVEEWSTNEKKRNAARGIPHTYIAPVDDICGHARVPGSEHV